MWIIEKAKRAFHAAEMQPIYGKLGGRSWLVIVFFAVTGFILAWHSRLTGAYAELATALSGFHVGRAIYQDRCGGHDDSHGQKPVV